MSQLDHPRRIVLSCLSVACSCLSVVVLAAPVALAAIPNAGHWVGKATKAQVGKGKNGRATFTVAASQTRMNKFQIPEVGAFCLTGYQVVSVTVPHAAIRHGAVNTTYKIPKVNDAKVHLKGRFTSATKFRGEVNSKSYCDYDIKFVAHQHR